jgi:hypothetical protein
MPAQVEIRGTAEFRRVAAKLKAAGNGTVAREMAKKMRTAAQPAVEDAQRSVKATAAAAGSRGGGGQARRAYTQSRRRKVTERAKRAAFEGRGLRATIARSLTTSVRAGGASASVQIKTRTAMLPPDQRTLPSYMNVGRWKHPVFDPARWVTQTVTPDQWFDRPMRRHGPRVRDEAVEVIDEINRKIVS